MKRRQEVVHRVLQWLATCPCPWNEMPDTLPDPCTGEPLDAAVFRYHVDLCEQAGFVRLKAGTPLQVQLTWAGHEARDARAAC